MQRSSSRNREASYYGGLMLKRVGISSLDDYAAALTRLLETILNAPGCCLSL